MTLGTPKQTSLEEPNFIINGHFPDCTISSHIFFSVLNKALQLLSSVIIRTSFLFSLIFFKSSSTLKICIRCWFKWFNNFPTLEKSFIFSDDTVLHTTSSIILCWLQIFLLYCSFKISLRSLHNDKCKSLSKNLNSRFTTDRILLRNNLLRIFTSLFFNILFSPYNMYSHF